MAKKSGRSVRMKREPLHQYDYDPKEFSRYRPSKFVDLDEIGIALATHIRCVCDLD